MHASALSTVISLFSMLERELKLINLFPEFYPAMHNFKQTAPIHCALDLFVIENQTELRILLRLRSTL